MKDKREDIANGNTDILVTISVETPHQVNGESQSRLIEPAHSSIDDSGFSAGSRRNQVEKKDDDKTSVDKSTDGGENQTSSKCEITSDVQGKTSDKTDDIASENEETKKEDFRDSGVSIDNSKASRTPSENLTDCETPNKVSQNRGPPKDNFHLKPNRDEDVGRKKRRAQLFLDIPSAHQQIPVLAVTPATGSAGPGHQRPFYDETVSSSPNVCVQCLFTAKLVWTLLLTLLDQITDAMAIERFFRTGHIFFFILSLIFSVFPFLIMCTYATNVLKRKLEWTWLDCVLNFPIAPYWLILVNITNSLKNGRHQARYEASAPQSNSLGEIIKDERAMSTLHALEGTLEAIPQVYIQIAAYMAIPVTSRYDEVVARLPLTISVISASWSIVANLDVGTNNVFWGGVHRFFAASEVGVAMTTRAMVAGGLFLQLYPGIWQWVWLIPIIASILVAWFTVFFAVRSFRQLLMPINKALAIPPADLEGICSLMPFLVTAMCLMPATYELLMYFVGFEFLAGLSWFCFTLPKEGNVIMA